MAYKIKGKHDLKMIFLLFHLFVFYLFFYYINGIFYYSVLNTFSAFTFHTSPACFYEWLLSFLCYQFALFIQQYKSSLCT